MKYLHVAYTNLIIPLSIFFFPINGGGGGFVPLSYASDSDADRIFNGVQSEGLPQ